MRTLFAIVFIAFITAGCAGNAAKAPEAGSAAASSAAVEDNTSEVMADQGQQPDMVCKRVKPIGSNIGKRVCRPRGAESPTREGDQEELRRVQDLSDDDRILTGE